MYEVLGKNSSNRVLYEDGVSFAPAHARTCDNYRDIIDSLDALRVQLADKYLSEADLSIVALRACVKCRLKVDTSRCKFEIITANIKT